MLWDPQRRIIANRLRSGRFARSIGPTSFYPMIAGAATPEQVEELMAHLDDPTRFGGEPGIPGCATTPPSRTIPIGVVVFGRHSTISSGKACAVAAEIPPRDPLRIKALSCSGAHGKAVVSAPRISTP